MKRNKRSWDHKICYVLMLLCTAPVYILGIVMLVGAWTSDAENISNMSGKLFSWDFTNLWMGGHLARMGDLATLFDVTLYRTYLDQYFHAGLRRHEWSYPPHMLLISAPFSLVPLGLAHALWVVAGWLCSAFLLYRLRVGLFPSILVLLSPGMITNAMIGQSAAFTSVLLLCSLALNQRKSSLAGLWLGLLTLKPHLGIIGFISTLACRNYRAIAVASATALGMLLLVTCWLGPDVWRLWYAGSLQYMTQLMDADHGVQQGMVWSITPFYYLRGWGVSVSLAHLLQSVLAVVVVAVGWRLWRAECGSLHQKLAISALLTLLSTPYGHIYDLTLAAFAVALLYPYAVHIKQQVALYGLWLVPFVIPTITTWKLPLPPLLIVLVLVLFFPRSNPSLHEA